MTILWIVVWAVVVGLSLGGLGGGGGALAVPALVYGLGVSTLDATIVAKIVVGLSSLVAATMYARQGAIAPRLAAIMLLTGVPTALFGGRFAQQLSPTVLTSLLAVTILAAAGSMIRSALSSSNSKQTNAAASRSDHQPSFVWLLVAGATIGCMAGILGIGGGFLLVPVLVAYGEPMRRAVGTSLVVIAVSCAAGFISSWRNDLPWAATALFTGCSLAAAVIGFMISQHIKPTVLKLTFAGLLIAVGAWLFYESWSVGA